MDAVKVKENVDKAINFLTQTDLSVILKLILLVGMGLFMWWIKSAAKKMRVDAARTEEQTAKVETEIDQTKKSDTINEQVKTDGNKADIFLGE